MDNENLQQPLENNQEVVDNTQENQQESQQQEVQEQPKESFQAKNFRELREKALAVQRERDEYARKLSEYEAARNQAPSAPSNGTNDQDDDIVIAPDELAEGKHLQKVAKKIKNLEDQLKQYQQQSTVSQAEVKLRSEFADFEQVFSKENIETLNMLHPEIAQTLDESKDVYRKAKSAYLFIKQMGISDNAYKQDKELVQRNAAKPKPLASIAPQQGGDGALSRANAFANGLTDDLKQQLYKEMMEARMRPR